LSGGTASLLRRTRIAPRDDRLVLTLRRGDEGLYSDTVAKRFRQLGSVLDLSPVVEVS
jgi:hypothetical protein